MKKRYLLDCTLRDGGYVNDWAFGHDNIVQIFEHLASAGTDIIEIGFLDERRSFDMHRSIMPDTDSADRLLQGLHKCSAMVVGMIDYGTCSLEHVKPCRASLLDGIRVIFKKHLMHPAMQFCAELKKLGYQVFAQLVSVTSYSDAEMLELIQLANEIQPFAVSMVDTYGLMHPENLLHFFRLLDKNLVPGICLGFHAHNNLQMGYANCIAMLSNQSERSLIVDGTVYGMGKSAGNAPLELLMMHLNRTYGGHYDINPVLELMQNTIPQFYQPPTWGYSLPYYLSSLHECHPNYVAYLMGKQDLSVCAVNEILGQITEERKLCYDHSYAEMLYYSHIT